MKALNPGNWNPRLQLWCKAALKRRRPLSAERIAFPGARAARLEQYLFLGPGPGELQVQNRVSAVSPGTERATLLDLPNTPSRFPSYPGYSSVGEVVTIGAGIKGIRRGDRVATNLGHCSAGIVKADKSILVPAEVTDIEASFCRLATIALGGVRQAGLLAGESAAVMGRGVIGLLALKFLAVAGVRPLASIARSESRASAALEAGATEIINTNIHPNRLNAARFDVVIEATGSSEAIQAALRCTRDGGRIILLGSPRGVTSDLGVGELCDRGIQLVGSHISQLPDRSPAPGVDSKESYSRLFLELLAHKKMSVADLVTDRLTPETAVTFYERMSAGSDDSLGAVIDWGTHAGGSAFASWKRPQAQGNRIRPVQRLTAWAKSLTQDELTLPAELSQSLGNLRFALVGCGMAAPKTAQAICRAPSCSLTWAVDTNQEVLTRFSERFQVRGTARLEEMLAADDVDAVFVGVPHFLHANLAVQCAAAGKHIIMEKPLATSVADIDAMTAACRQHGVLMTTNYSRRYRPNVRYARKLVEQGAIGRLLGSCIVHGEEKSRRYWLDPQTEQPNWRGGWATSGGGILMNVLVHHLDYFGYITGEPISSVSCDYDILTSPPGVAVEDIASVRYRYANGAIGTMVASAHCPGAQEYEVLWGTDGQIRLTRETGEFWSRKTLLGKPAGAWHAFPSLPSIDSRAELIERFARAVFANTEPDIAPGDSRRVTQVVERAYRHVQESAPDSLSTEFAEST